MIGGAGCLDQGTDQEEPPVERYDQPSAEFRFTYNEDTEELAIAHDDGDTLQNKNLSIVFSDNSVIEDPFADETVRPGREITVNTSDLEASGVVRVIWTGEGHSKTLDEWEY